ncbi:MAG: ComEA family DNA-binding protein [Corynebacterium sp.]|nr:ComEA family DNA-binding protein [Corynebacterium sp.]
MKKNSSIRDRISEITQPTGAEEKMQVSYPKPRFAVKPVQVIGFLAILAVLVGGLVLREPSPPAAPPPTWEEQEAGPSILVVSVQGAVANPGMYTVEAGVRVGDLLTVAEPHSNADISSLNHAQKLVDGQQITIHRIGEAPAAAAESAKVSINTATAAELEKLPGIGPATAHAIVVHREKNGPFEKLEDITEIKGIGPRTLERFIDQIEL